jgi:hypothetical protein
MIRSRELFHFESLLGANESGEPGLRWDSRSPHGALWRSCKEWAS